LIDCVGLEQAASAAIATQKIVRIFMGVALTPRAASLHAAAG
jgi:hypothetical protein